MTASLTFEGSFDHVLYPGMDQDQDRSASQEAAARLRRAAPRS